MPQDNLNEIKIITAIFIPEENLELLAKKISGVLNLEEYKIIHSVKKEIIGGIIIFANGYRFDYSIKRKLDKIADDLKLTGTIDTDNKESTDISKIIKDTLCEVLTSRDIDLLSEGIIEEVGTVIATGDSIATISGIINCRNGELIRFNNKTFGIAMDLKEKIVKVVLLGDINSVHEGMICTRTNKTIDVPVGKSLLGRVVNSLGEAIDGMGPISFESKRPIESKAPSIVDRQPVNKSLQTGIIAIDSMIPIGRGQRELIIGDRQTGKTSIALDTIINQRGKGVFCIYVAIGQKMSTIFSVVNTLRNHNAMSYTTVVAAGAGESASMQYIAPYSGCAMAEELMYNDKADVLIIYDDLTKHAQAYRSISLLLKRPPGREAYPGDVFYLHSRLLERSARLSKDLGGGSITALPIIETQVGDISGYIPTNLISITDGQIYLEEELFLSGQRPAINVGLSVSRVGGSAQTPAMKRVSSSLRINMAQYKELEAFSQFGSDLDESTRSQIVKGHNLMEILKQDRYEAMEIPQQILLLYLANTNKFSSFYSQDIKPFFAAFIDFINSVHPGLMESIENLEEFNDKMRRTVDVSFGEYYQLWKAQMEDYGTDI